MSFQIRDHITPDLARAARKLSDKKPVLEAMGLQLVSITQRAFDDESLRVKNWPPLKAATIQVKLRDGKSERLLKASGLLWKSTRITALASDSVTVGSDRIYAAIQQFGSVKTSGRGSGIPARPFFPFASQNSKMAEFAQEKIRKAALAKLRRLLGS